MSTTRASNFFKLKSGGKYPFLVNFQSTQNREKGGAGIRGRVAYGFSGEGRWCRGRVISRLISSRFRPGEWGVTIKILTLLSHPKEKGGQKIGLQPRKSLAEVHGNRTHLPPYSEGTPDLKSGGPTSEPRTSSGKPPPRHQCLPGLPGRSPFGTPLARSAPAWPPEYITASAQSKTPEGPDPTTGRGDK